MAGPHQPTVACGMGKDFCVKPLWFFTASMTQLMLTDPPPLLGPTQTTLRGNHTNIFPGLKLGADGHLVIATADDLERAREAMRSTRAAATPCVLVGCGLLIDTVSPSEPSATLLSAGCR